MPLYSKEEPLAYLIFGCYLDNFPIEEQWERTRALLDWWQGSLDELHRAFSSPANSSRWSCAPMPRR